jgi:hypothetical protein
MFPSMTVVMAEQKLADLQAEYLRRDFRLSLCEGTSRRRAKRTTTRWHRLSEWAGYRMIGMGCRLARPAVVARVQAEL